MTTEVATIEEIKEKFTFNAEVFIGEPSYVQFIKHPINVRTSEDGLCAVQIGTLSGDIFYIDDDIANQSDDILVKMERYLESGDHDGLISLEIIKIDDGTYRLYGTPAEEIDDNGNDVEPLEIDKPSLQELLNSF